MNTNVCTYRDKQNIVTTYFKRPGLEGVHNQTPCFFDQTVFSWVCIILFLNFFQPEEGEEAGLEMMMRRREQGDGHLDQALCLTFWNPRWEFSPLMVGELVWISYSNALVPLSGQ